MSAAVADVADVLFIGSSPNALAGAARLAKAGRRVVVLETCAAVGGVVATDTFAPGARVDSGVMGVTLDAEIARELGVTVDVVRRDVVTLLGDEPMTVRAPAGDLAGASAAVCELPKAFHDAVALLRAIYRAAPTRVPEPGPMDAARLAAFAGDLRGLGGRGMHEVLRLVFMPVRDFVDELRLAPGHAALLAGAAVRGLTEGPFAAGTMFGLLHRAALGDAIFRGTARGGAQRVAEALADACRAAGVDVRTGVPGPLRIHLDPADGALARGVTLGDGTTVAASQVVSDLDVRTTFTSLVPPYALDPEDNRAVRRLRYRGSVARVHLALHAKPSFNGVDDEALAGTLVVAPSVASLERAWDDGKRGAASKHPYVELTIPSIADPSLAPAGQHVLDAWVQHVPRGADRGAVVKALVEQLTPFAPRLADLVIHHAVSRPEELEARFGVTEGQLDGGEIRLDQAFFLRPLPGYEQTRTPIANLSFSGGAAHPGGNSGLSGWHLAARLLESGS